MNEQTEGVEDRGQSELDGPDPIPDGWWIEFEEPAVGWMWDVEIADGSVRLDGPVGAGAID
jgi:hypothetical protein